MVPHGVPAVIYGAGPRTVLESNAKRADEHLVLADLRRATKVVARTLARHVAGRMNRCGAHQYGRSARLSAWCKTRGPAAYGACRIRVNATRPCAMSR